VLAAARLNRALRLMQAELKLAMLMEGIKQAYPGATVVSTASNATGLERLRGDPNAGAPCYCSVLSCWYC